jgi:DNA-binding NtrC family response regulator
MRTVLVVDDDEFVLRFCANVLADLRGTHVLEATNGNQAIDVATHYHGGIELLVSDIMMPGGVSGLDLAEYLTSSRPEIKVLLMSGHWVEEFTIKTAWHFLAKPFRPSDLLGKVEAILAAGSVVDVVS